MSVPQPFQVADPSKDKHFHDTELPPLPASTSAEHEYAQPDTNSAPLDISAPVVSASGLLPPSDVQTSVADNQSPVSITQDSAPAVSSSAELSTPAPAPRSPSPAFLPPTGLSSVHATFAAEPSCRCTTTTASLSSYWSRRYCQPCRFCCHRFNRVRRLVTQEKEKEDARSIDPQILESREMC